MLKRRDPTNQLARRPRKRKISQESEVAVTATESNGNHAASLPAMNPSYYPPQMSIDRCAMYSDGRLQRPIKQMEDKLATTNGARNKIATGAAVLHWFRRDLRITDNRGLEAAYRKAAEKAQDLPLVGLFIVSPEDYDAHSASPVRVDFELRALQKLKDDLACLDIPLFLARCDHRCDIPAFVVNFCKKWEINNVYCNMQYEVDELRRDTLLIGKCLEDDIAFNPIHDECIVPPGRLSSGTGNQYAVFKPWYGSWVRYMHSNKEVTELSAKPGRNPTHARSTFRHLFDCPVPSAPKGRLTEEERSRFRKLWPAGEDEASRRLEKFSRTKRMMNYATQRDFPSAKSTSRLSPYIAIGAISSRQCVLEARRVSREHPVGKAQRQEIEIWIKEIAWRDFYRHVMVHWPWVCMFMPFKPEFINIAWEYDKELFDKWCQSRTGFPIIDAAMAQLRHEAWMPNRCRMIVASFLAKDLLQDWRLGEKYFMEQLIDGDFASNNGGWGFSSSTGVDPQPYFRIFNPTLQSKKFDPEGEYIRKWVPQLEHLSDAAIHDPYNSGEEAAKIARNSGYPRPCVDHSERRKIALQKYKEALGRA